jgi:hypothetical protein
MSKDNLTLKLRCQSRSENDAGVSFSFDDPDELNSNRRVNLMGMDDIGQFEQGADVEITFKPTDVRRQTTDGE